MANQFSRFWSSVGKKYIMGLTGLIWVGFLTGHLLGNLMLFSPDPDHFNAYAEFLISTGELLYFAEAALVIFLLSHIGSGISVFFSGRKARPDKYVKSVNAGGSSKKTLSSVTMIYTGGLMLIFLVGHIAMFKYGVGSDIDDDLYLRVYTAFSDPVITIFYVVILTLLGFHLRHGFWSAFQSLGLSHPRYSPIIFGLGITIAVVYAAGFIAIPLYIFFSGGA